jgi:signal transduction histidine kinase
VRKPRPITQSAPVLRLKLRTKLVVAMAFAALVPVAIVASIATGVILSNLETGLREDAERQLTVGLNLILRTVERLGDECSQLSETGELAVAMTGGAPALDRWLAHELAYVTSARIQLLDTHGEVVFDRMVVGSLTCDPAQAEHAGHPECQAARRFTDVGVAAGERATSEAWSRDVTLVAVGDRVIVRAVSPVVDAALALRGVVVLSMPLDGDFADSIKGALSADVLIGGTAGRLDATFRSQGRRAAAVALSAADRATALAGQRAIRAVDLPVGRYTIAATSLKDEQKHPVGIVGVAVDRAPLEATRALAIRSLIAGGAGALVFGVGLALFWSRRLGAPIAELHRGAIAVSRGDLDHRIEIPGGDELTDLADAFNQMTSTLKDNQARLAARMREIVALHDAGRAVSSVIDLDQVSRKIVDAVARTFDVQLAALWLVENDRLRASAARARRTDVSSSLATDEALATAEGLRTHAESVMRDRAAVRYDSPSPLVALPLERKNRVVGVLAVARAEDARGFSDADLNLLTTFADQAGAAVENAQLYHEVRGASEELDKKVKLRTAELTAINSELGKAITELRETQAQLVLSERMAGLGLLVAGVAHEINSPSAAIRGSIDGLAGAIARVARHGPELAPLAGYFETAAPELAERPLATALAARKAARELAPALGELDVANDLADLGATADDAARFVDALGGRRELAPAAVAALADHVFLHRTASTVRHAVGQIQRIVGALKSYSHLDQQATRIEADLHEGLETTLALLHHALRDIKIERRYGTLPRVAIYVDELNQVWTNLIQNAQQALGGKGSVVIETLVAEKYAIVRVIDDGPGVPADALPRIFEPFFTTKPKGEGTGLGLGICRQIVAKHGGELRCESVPGRTCFEVRLPT